MSYTDNTIMTWGAHKGKALANTPAKWLLWAWREIYHEEPDTSKPLSVYIFENLKAIESEAKTG